MSLVEVTLAKLVYKANWSLDELALAETSLGKISLGEMTFMIY